MQVVKRYNVCLFSNVAISTANSDSDFTREIATIFYMYNCKVPITRKDATVGRMHSIMLKTLS